MFSFIFSLRSLFRFWSTFFSGGFTSRACELSKFYDLARIVHVEPCWFNKNLTAKDPHLTIRLSWSREKLDNLLSTLVPKQKSPNLIFIVWDICARKIYKRKFESSAKNRLIVTKLFLKLSSPSRCVYQNHFLSRVQPEPRTPARNLHRSFSRNPQQTPDRSW